MLLNDIEKIHRGKKKDNNDDVPLVYIKFHSWKTAQSILKEIIHGNNNKKLTISEQEMYSKATQKKWTLQTESREASRISHKRKSGSNIQK